MFYRVTAIAGLLLLGACSTEIVSREQGQIAIQTDSAHNLDHAAREANRYCAKSNGMSAKLDRTEQVGNDAVAYFSCV